MVTQINNHIKLKYDVINHQIVVDKMVDFKVDDNVRKSLIKVDSYLSKLGTGSDLPIENIFDDENNRAFIREQINGKSTDMFSSGELESLADSFLSLQATKTKVYCWENDIRSTYHNAKALIRNYDLSMSLATQLVSKQHSYLQSQNWMDKKRLTFLQVASMHTNYSEPTIRRRLHMMHFILGNWKISALDLLCANNLPFTCKHVARILNNHPEYGRPHIYKCLHEEGYRFSDGQIKNALALLHYLSYSRSSFF